MLLRRILWYICVCYVLLSISTELSPTPTSTVCVHIHNHHQHTLFMGLVFVGAHTNSNNNEDDKANDKYGKVDMIVKKRRVQPSYHTHIRKQPTPTSNTQTSNTHTDVHPLSFEQHVDTLLSLRADTHSIEEADARVLAHTVHTLAHTLTSALRMCAHISRAVCDTVGESVSVSVRSLGAGTVRVLALAVGEYADTLLTHTQHETHKHADTIKHTNTHVIDTTAQQVSVDIHTPPAVHTQPFQHSPHIRYYQHALAKRLHQVQTLAHACEHTLILVSEGVEVATHTIGVGIEKSLVCVCKVLEVMDVASMALLAPTRTRPSSPSSVSVRNQQQEALEPAHTQSTSTHKAKVRTQEGTPSAIGSSANTDRTASVSKQLSARWTPTTASPQTPTRTPTPTHVQTLTTPTPASTHTLNLVNNKQSPTPNTPTPTRAPAFTVLDMTQYIRNYLYPSNDNSNNNHTNNTNNSGVTRTFAHTRTHTGTDNRTPTVKPTSNTRTDTHISSPINTPIITNINSHTLHTHTKPTLVKSKTNTQTSTLAHTLTDTWDTAMTVLESLFDTTWTVCAHAYTQLSIYVQTAVTCVTVCVSVCVSVCTRVCAHIQERLVMTRAYASDVSIQLALCLCVLLCVQLVTTLSAHRQQHKRLLWLLVRIGVMMCAYVCVWAYILLVYEQTVRNVVLETEINALQTVFTQPRYKHPTGAHTTIHADTHTDTRTDMDWDVWSDEYDNSNGLMWFNNYLSSVWTIDQQTPTHPNIFHTNTPITINKYTDNIGGVGAFYTRTLAHTLSHTLTAHEQTQTQSLTPSVFNIKLKHLQLGVHAPVLTRVRTYPKVRTVTVGAQECVHTYGDGGDGGDVADVVDRVNDIVSKHTQSHTNTHLDTQTDAGTSTHTDTPTICESLVMDIHFTYAAPDFAIEFSLRQNDVRSFLPEASLQLGDLRAKGVMRMNMQLLGTYPFFGNATVSA
jgi:hypothetical protein